MNSVRIDALGDTALLLRFGESIDTALNLRVHSAAAALRAATLPGVRNLVPAYASLTLHYDPRAWADPQIAHTPYVRIAEQVREVLAELPVANALDTLPDIEIPVCYGGEFGPDLQAVAMHDET